MKSKIQKCRVCGCTEDDCTMCIIITSRPCYWIEKDLCSACAPEKNDGSEFARRMIQCFNLIIPALRRAKSIGPFASKSLDQDIRSYQARIDFLREKFPEKKPARKAVR